MKFGQFFFENHAENKVQGLVPDLFLFFEKALYQVLCTLVSIYLDSPPLGHTIKTNCLKHQSVDPEICSIPIFYERVWD